MANPDAQWPGCVETQRTASRHLVIEPFPGFFRDKEGRCCMNAANSLIPLILQFLPQKRNLLIPLGLSGIMQQRRIDRTLPPMLTWPLTSIHVPMPFCEQNDRMSINQRRDTRC